MRILFATTSGAGHFGPLIPFAHACRRAGHQVLVAGQDGAAGLAAQVGLRFFPVAEPPRDDVAHLDALPARERSDSYVRLHGRAALPGMVAAIQDWRPDVVVRESGEVASLIAAERLRVPHARVEIGLSTPTLAPALSELRLAAGLAAAPPRRELCLTLAPASLDGPGASRAVRRFRDPAAAWAPSLWGEWGDPQAPLALLSFGTKGEPVRYRAALDALAGLGLRILVTTGGWDPGLLGPLESSVRAERWVAHAAVLRDAAVMVGHGGAGSTLGALAAGVPMALLPQFADQPSNAARVEALGAGIALGDVEGLAGAVRRLLSFPEYADRARRVRDEIQALPPVDAAVDELMRLADGEARAA